jgi:hypothetical protein
MDIAVNAVGRHDLERILPSVHQSTGVSFFRYQIFVVPTFHIIKRLIVGALPEPVLLDVSRARTANPTGTVNEITNIM